MKDLISLAIETSCDETSAAVLKNGREVLSNIIMSQIDIHKKFGGVVPEVASRNHVKDINPVIIEALEKASIGFNDLDFVSVTYGPGLVGALLIGLSSAKALAYALDIPLVGVHHIEGHIAGNYIAHKDLEPPFICLVVSGGHTHLVKVEDYGKYEILGKTRDDAAGEAYDKVARSLGLGYPGGPLIDKLAKEGDKSAIKFPRTYLDDSYDFSFSGLKSAVLNYLNSMKMKEEEINRADVAASFQEAVIEVLSNKAIRAAKEFSMTKIAIAGGVSANSALRERLTIMAKENNLEFYYPPMELCTDNAAMIGSAGYYEYIRGYKSDLNLNAKPSLRLGQK
ncbi:N6-L-threonylcarbamoyladenine synthase [Acetoanaerobium pronyense]|uniref:tRNA N6-adenosine threonylcarbamoyltransferase n=1 Tax=Acetoanaerobium pronyense TaxID=1482736 RepID=A0ABS4KIX1_9FIRM|nr:tRNA (adenosine(37)-N6)-threonylcarbamoyltransferase complex transferase subunit TsaD [Acetoanaerobium pronyense]MBP2027734.1 N6-L-threonylcarbamoyladenine synthase [Acetoanaerobium pronyense]